MSKPRNCAGHNLATGVSPCPLDMGKIIGAIIVPYGTKLPANLTGAALEELCHASIDTRVYPLYRFAEYAPNGGDVAVSAVGYGPTAANGVNAKTDTFTFEKYNAVVAASLMKTANVPYGVYYVDENNVIYGLEDGTDVLAPFPMSTIYPTDTPHPTSSNQATLLVNFCHEDARDVIEHKDAEQLDFNVMQFAKGLVPVKFQNVGTTASPKWKLIEVFGGNDRTDEFASALSTNAATCLVGASACTANADGTLTITATNGFKLADPSVLYTKGIKFIVQTA